MVRVVAAGGVWIVVLAAGLAPASEAGTDVRGPVHEALARAFEEASGGDLARPGTWAVWTLDGPIERAATGRQLLDLLGELLGAMGQGDPGVPPPQLTDGRRAVGLGDATTADHFDWPNCHYATTVLIYVGNPLSAIAKAEPAGGLAPPAGGELCNAPAGSTRLWADVTFDRTRPAVNNPIQFCTAAVLWATGTADVPAGPGGLVCDVPAGAARYPCASHHGRGFLFTAQFFNLAIDIFFGGGNAVTLGGAPPGGPCG